MGHRMMTYWILVASHDSRSPAARESCGGLVSHSVRRRLLAWLGIVVAAGLICGGAALYFWRHGHSAPSTTPDLATVEVWIANGQYDRATQALRKHVRRAPHDGAARLMLARALAATGDFTGCARELQQVPNWWPRKAEALYREGQAYLLLNRARDAEAAFLSVTGTELVHAPDPAVFHDASQELLSLYATENRWEEVHTILWKVYDRSSLNYRPTVLAMRIQSELERIAPSESAKRLRRYVDADPDDWEARRALANAQLALGEHAKALREMQTCLEARSKNPRAWRDYLTMLEQIGEMDAFGAALACVPSVADTEPDIWSFRGEDRERAGDWANAAAHYRRALELKPDLENVHYRLSNIERRLGHAADAAAHRQRWQTLQGARTELRQAYSEYVDAQERCPNDSIERLASIKRLAGVCQTLGWSRTAEALHRLAVR
jgi:tetratricopeptide (TPR) repeat protein